MSDAALNIAEAEEITAKDVAFEEDPPREGDVPAEYDVDALLLNIDGYEGPIDVLLIMARDQKVDLRKISILQLARQYLSFMDRAVALRLDLAAEYLVMAAWLAYLKSRLLLPKQDDDGDGPTAEQLAEALQFQLRRLEATQKAATALFSRPQLGRDIFPRGMPERLKIRLDAKYDATLYDLFKAYGDIERRQKATHYELPTFHLMSMEAATERMTRMFGKLPRKGPWSVWTTLQSFIPEGVKDKLFARSSLASMLTVGLEMAKQGKIEIRQDGPFRPVYLRASLENLSKEDESAEAENTEENKEEESEDGNGSAAAGND